MKNKLILIAALALLALPVMAQDPVVLTPTKLYDLIEELQKNAGADRVAFSHDDQEQRNRIEALEKRLAHQDHMGGVYQTRILRLEKKVTHITNILKLKQENGK